MPWSFSFPSSTTSALVKRRAIIAVASFVAIVTTYKIVNHSLFSQSLRPNNNIRRSNAIRRRQRAETNSTRSDNVVPNLQLDDSDQVEETRFLSDQNLVDSENNTEDTALNEEYEWNIPPQADERHGENIVQLLFRVSEDATKRNAYIHRGCACNCCGMVPIRGIRYRCANCADYDLCESCEAQGVHTKTHIFYKVRVPVSVIGPRNIQPVWYSGDPDSVTRQLSRETLLKLYRETGFERPKLDAQWEQWTFMANVDWKDDPLGIHLAMDRKTFERCLMPTISYRHASPCLIFDRMFAFYDTNKDDLIGFSEFLHGLAFRKKKDKWKKIFEGYDIDEDGYVDRKDFLRIFRSYYVLYRSLHAEMLDGMAEQQMSSADVHRLVSSRQPLSSLFGQDGRFPRAPNSRAGEGKNTQTNGDLEITDGKGVINESSLDHGRREDVFKQEFLKSNWTDDFANSRGYWESILNPPETVEQLQSRLQETQLNYPQSMENDRHPSNSINRGLDLLSTQACRIPMLDDEDDDINSDSDADSWPPSFIQITDEDAEAVEGPGTRVADVRNSNRREVISHACLRLRVKRDAILQFRTQRDIYMRWQRRYFYTEEEEGGKPPADWKDEYDILLQNDIIGESTRINRQSLPSRSSSSKVHFAEASNGFDVRSNPSVSSRNLPERWGGLEISDAERDAGKEILYQVTQQAFNQLLDPLFQDNEDLAIEAASTKMEREKYRHLYTTPEFKKWAVSQPKRRLQKYPDQSNILSKNEINFWINPNLQVDVDILGNNSSLQNGASHNSTLESTFQNLNVQLQPSLHTELLNIITHYDDHEDHEDQRDMQAGLLTQTLSGENLRSSEYRDPTMPQFRPNSLFQTSNNDDSHVSPTESCDVESLSDKEQHSNDKEARISSSKNLSPDSNIQTRVGSIENEKVRDDQKENLNVGGVSKAKLLRHWLCDEATKDAELKGGWGRINYKEFERKVQIEIAKEKRERPYRERNNTSKMDYLGSWIEFCIP